jgi:hypothetical protein
LYSVIELAMKLSPPDRADCRQSNPTTSTESVWYSSLRLVW